MRLSLVVCALTLCLVLCPPAPAQTGGSARVAVIDLSALFRQHHRFTAATAALQDETNELEHQTRREHHKLRQRAQRLKQLSANSAAHRREERAVAQQMSALQSKAALKKAQLLRREARIYAEAYRELTKELEAYCRRHDIVLVLRYDSRPPQPEEGRALQAGRQRAIVYQQRLDITPHLLETINARRRPTFGREPLTRESLPGPVRFLTTVPEVAAKRVATARAAWALNDLIFPPAS